MPEGLLDRRWTEAGFAKAIFDVLAGEAGRERAVEIFSKAAIRLATEAGGPLPDKRARNGTKGA